MYILEAQLFKLREQYNKRQQYCTEYCGYCHLGYINTIFTDKNLVSKWTYNNCNNLLPGVRLVLREYDREYLNIAAPYNGTINKLVQDALNMLPGVNSPCMLGPVSNNYLSDTQYFIETQVSTDSGWCHMSYGSKLYDSKMMARMTVDMQLLSRDGSRSVVREHRGELLGVLHMYGEYVQ